MFERGRWIKFRKQKRARKTGVPSRSGRKRRGYKKRIKEGFFEA